MKTRTTTTILTVLIAVAVAAAKDPYEVAWTAQIGTTEREDGRSVAVDASGNAYVSGYTAGDLGQPNAGGRDAFLSKFDASGNEVWTRLIGAGNNDLSNSVAVDGSGDIYISGYTSGDLGGTSAGGKDAFLSKLDSSGNALWTRQIGTSADDVSMSVAVAGSGDVYIGGYTSGDLDGTNAGGKDAFLSKFDADGNAVWTRQIGTSDTDCGLAVTVAVSGDVYISGRTAGDLGGPNAGRHDAFLVKFDADGNAVWTRQIGTSSLDESNSVATDASGDVYISGVTGGILYKPFPGLGGAFLIRLDADGNEVWRKQFGKQCHEGSHSVAVDASGNSYISGYTSADFGGTNAGGMDAFLSKIDADGNQVWLTQIGTSEWEQTFAVAVDASDGVYISGTTRGGLCGPIVGSYDAFLVKYGLSQPGREGPPVTPGSFAVTPASTDDSVAPTTEQPSPPFTPGGFMAIAASADASFALTTDGHIAGWGDESALVDNTPIAGGFTAIAAGYGHCLGLTADGRIVSWGSDSYQDRDMPKGGGFTAVAAGWSHSLALTADGYIVSWGRGREGDVRDTPDSDGFTAIAAGYDYSVAITADGAIVGWGRDESGQVSDIPADGRFTMIVAGRRHVLALTSKGHIAAWGDDEFGQVTDAPTGGGFVAIATGNDNCLALAADGTVVFWGKDEYSRLKRGPTASGFVAIGIGREHAIALTAGGHIVSWGQHRSSNVAATPRTSEFVAVAAGFKQGFALTADGFIVGWGIWCQETPTGSGFTAIAAGDRHGLALTADGRIVGWGRDTLGQVSDAPADKGFTAIAAGAAYSMALTADGRIVSWGSDEFGQMSDTPVAAGFMAIAAGMDHCLALTADGHLVSWGKDTDKQVSNTPTGGGFTAIAAGSFHSIALTTEGKLVSWGDEGPRSAAHGPLTRPPSGGDFTAIAAGGYDSAAMTLNGRVEYWGVGKYPDQTGARPGERDLAAVAVGRGHTVLLDDDGNVYCWGDDYGDVVEIPTAGVFVPDALSGQVFADRNANGQRDAGEFGLDGWTVELVAKASRTVVATRTTDSVDLNSDGWIDPDSEVGVYEFGDAAPDDYEVRAPLRNGWRRTLPYPRRTYNVPLGIGRKDAAALDFGYVAYGEVEGLVWADVDKDRVRDADEPGLNGWTVELVDAATGVVVDTAVTAGDTPNADDPANSRTQAGQYLFKRAPLGSYEVRPVMQAGWASTAPIVATGKLAQRQFLTDDPDTNDVTRVRSMVAAGDGRHVYAAGFAGFDGTIGVFTRDLRTGELSFIDDANALAMHWGGNHCSIAISGDGAHVYAGGSISGPVAVFKRDPATGQLNSVQGVKLDDVDGIAELKGNWSLAITDDGEHLYAVGGYKDDGVLVSFNRDTTTGELSFVQAIFNGVDGVTGLAEPTSVAVSPAGTNVYVAGHQDDAIAIFTSDAATGTLTFVQDVRNGVDGVDGLDGPRSVTVSRDGNHVYVASQFASTVTVFARDAATGRLDLVQVVQDDAGGIDGLAWAMAATVSDDGAHVYVAGYHDFAIAVFARDPATGELSLLQVMREGVDGADPLWRVTSVIVSKDGRHVYAAGEDTILTAFERLHSPRPTVVDVPPNGSVTGVALGVAETVNVSGR